MTIPTSSISVVIRVEVIVDYCSNTRQISLELKLKLLAVKATSPGGSKLK